MHKYKAIAYFFQHYVTAFLVCVGLLGLLFSVPLSPKGDSAEYQMVAETLWFDRSLIFSRKVLDRHDGYYPQKTEATDGYQTIAGKGNVQYLISHSFYYPLFALPFFGIAVTLLPDKPILGMYIFNVFLVGIAYCIVLFYFSRVRKLRLAPLYAAGFMLLSPVVPYVFWTTPETFVFTVVLLYLMCLFVFRASLCAGVLLGIAVGQMPIMFPFALPLIVDGTIGWGQKIRALIVAAGISVIPFGINYQLTDTLFPLSPYVILSGQAIWDFIHVLLDPAMGLIWFYPFVYTAMFSLRLTLRSSVLIIAAGLSLLLGMMNSQFYTAQIGHRYLHYIYPVFLFLLDSGKLKKPLLIAILAVSAFFAPGLYHSQVTVRNDIDISTSSYLPYRLAKYLFLYRYSEHPEVFAYHARPLDNDWKWKPHLIYFDNADPDSYYEEDRWFKPGMWLRFIFWGFSPGKVALYFDRERYEVKARLNRREYISHNGVLDITLLPSDIVENGKMGKYTYIDIWFSGWRPVDEGIIGDDRILGNRFASVSTPDEKIYEFPYDR